MSIWNKAIRVLAASLMGVTMAAGAWPAGCQQTRNVVCDCPECPTCEDWDDQLHGWLDDWLDDLLGDDE